jgi:ABC-type amino acid transport substrate-binding protein
LKWLAIPVPVRLELKSPRGSEFRILRLLGYNELKRLGLNDEYNLVLTSDYSRAVLLVLKGRADLLAGNRLFLNEQLKLHSKDISAVHPVFKLAPSTVYIAFGLKTNDILVEAYRQALLEVKQSESYAQIMTKWQLDLSGE